MTEPQTLFKARQLKSILNQISDASLEYRELNNVLPYSKAKYEGKLNELIEMYEKIIERLINVLKTTDYFKSLTNSEYEYIIRDKQSK